MEKCTLSIEYQSKHQKYNHPFPAMTPEILYLYDETSSSFSEKFMIFLSKAQDNQSTYFTFD